MMTIVTRTDDDRIFEVIPDVDKIKVSSMTLMEVQAYDPINATPYTKTIVIPDGWKVEII